MDDTIRYLAEYTREEDNRIRSGARDPLISGSPPEGVPHDSDEICRNCGMCCFTDGPLPGPDSDGTPEEYLTTDGRSLRLKQRRDWFAVFVEYREDGPDVKVRNACAALTENKQCSLVDQETGKDNRPPACKNYEPSEGEERETPCVAEGGKMVLEVRDGKVLYDARSPEDERLLRQELRDNGVEVPERTRETDGLFDSMLEVSGCGSCTGCDRC